MFNNQYNHLSYELREVIFEIITRRIETCGWAMNDSSIVLSVTTDEYEIVDMFWKEFQDYVMISTGKWVPATRERVDTKEGYEFYVNFKPSILARIRKSLKRFFGSLDNAKLKPESARVSLHNKKNFT